jgi:hypothetical protein
MRALLLLSCAASVSALAFDLEAGKTKVRSHNATRRLAPPDAVHAAACRTSRPPPSNRFLLLLLSSSFLSFHLLLPLPPPWAVHG